MLRLKALDQRHCAIHVYESPRQNRFLADYHIVMN